MLDLLIICNGCLTLLRYTFGSKKVSNVKFFET
ncbi:hypothetical protein CDO51_11825 [Natranaerobius trueperi]|uniref:Uncharacterized protein n=1 Tax=Natranaerobius trueperi TaxID=759412 RepID=A0A226BV43_9FIRM|nr:hypothetical protein CDO51_11825 [Natranaerobius trueperi]